MKSGNRRRPIVAPFLLANSLPAATFGLIALAGGLARAQSATPKPAPSVPSQSQNAPAQTPKPDTPKPDAPKTNAKPQTPAPTTPAPTQTPAAVPPAQTPAAPTPAPPQTAPPVVATPQVVPPLVVPGGPVIGEIEVRGNKILNTASILITLEDRGIKIGSPCNDQTLTQIQQRLYQTGNYGQHSTDVAEAVRVRSEQFNPPDGRCKVVIEVDENEPIKNVQVTGSGPIKPEEIRNLIQVSPDKTNPNLVKIYNEAQFLRDTLAIQDLYNKKGYTITFGQDAGPDEKNSGQLNVPIIVTRVGKITLINNKKTKRKVILREMKTKEGDFYNRSVFNDDIRRLYNLDYLESVNPAENSVAPGVINLTLSVAEKRTGTVSVAVGYSNRQQLVGRAEIGETNFRGEGEGLNLLWETGGAANRNSVELGFNKPWLDKRRTALGIQLYDKTIYRFSNSLQQSSIINPIDNSNVGTDNRYNEQRTGATLTLSRPFRDTYRGAITLRGENVRTDNLDLSGINAEIIQNGPIYSIAGSLLHNTRDLDLDPVTGGTQSLSVEVGQARLKDIHAINGTTIPGLGNVNFGKSSLELKQYLNLQSARKRSKPDEEKRSLALRFIIGASAGTLPFFEQFFVGGADSVRGYREDRYWGKYMLLGSVELRQPLARSLKGVLFFDIGDAWGGRYQDTRIEGFDQHGFSLHPGFGAGIRVRTPIGPLRLDFGFGTEGGRTHFSISNTF